MEAENGAAPFKASWREVTGELREQRKRSSTEWGAKLWAIFNARQNDASAQLAIEIIEGVFSLDQYKAFVRSAGITGIKASQFRRLAAGFEGVARTLVMWRSAKAETKSASLRKKKFNYVANAARQLVKALRGLDNWQQWSMLQASRHVRRAHQDGGRIKNGKVNLNGFGISSPVDAAQIFTFLTDPYYAEALCQSAQLAHKFTYPLPDADVLAIKGLTQLTGLPLTRNPNLIALGECFFLEVKKAVGDDPEEEKQRRIEDLIDRAKLLR